MVITTLEARVAPEKAAVLEAEFRQAVQKLDAGILQTFLLRGASDPDVWQIVTIWESREALEAMRNSGETARGVVILRAAGAEPPPHRGVPPPASRVLRRRRAPARASSSIFRHRRGRSRGPPSRSGGRGRGPSREPRRSAERPRPGRRRRPRGRGGSRGFGVSRQSLPRMRWVA